MPPTNLSNRAETVLGVVDTIYQAALDPCRWDAVFAALRQQLRSPIAGMFTQDAVTGAYSGDRLPLDEKYHRLYAERIAAVNPWIRVPGLMRPGRVLSDQSLERLHRNRTAYVETEFHQDFARPQGFRHVMGGTLIVHGHRLVNFTYFRTQAEGPYTRAEMRRHGLLARHIANAVGLSGELQTLRTQMVATSYLVERLAFGFILLDARKRIVFANREARRILSQSDGLGERGATMQTSYPADSARLETLIRGASADGTAPIARAIIARPSGRMALSLAAMPVPRDQSMLDVGGATTLILVSDPERRPVLDQRYLAARFGFTASEARLASSLAQGLDLHDAAIATRLTYETARWYLKTMFGKTGTRRQSQLVSVLLADLAALAVTEQRD